MNKPFRVCLPSVLLTTNTASEQKWLNNGKGRWQTGIEVLSKAIRRGSPLDCPFNHAAQMVIK
jgi:hypothetical protein